MENNIFLGPYPKVFYFTEFENMRKRLYTELPSPTVMLRFFRNLIPSEPEVYLPQFNLRNITRHLLEHHLILGLFPNGKDDIYTEQMIEVFNKYSHLPFYA